MPVRPQADARDRVQLFARVPHAALRPFIERFLVVEFPSFHRDAHLPGAGAVAAFSLRGKCRIDDALWAPPAAFTGLRGTLRAHEHCDNHAVLLVAFTPAGAAAFVPASLQELAGTTTDLSSILGRPAEIDRLHEQLCESGNHERRVELLEEFMLERLANAEPDPLVKAAVARLESDAGGSRIDELARYVGLSQSALERRFRRIVGISPKKFASILRLQRAVQLRAGGADLTAVAHGAGYFDQSHFINDFRRATGSSPEAFFERVAAE
jgi:AraC-like DNA-binding protein